MMSSQFPEYREDKGHVIPNGWYVWTRQHPSGIWFHILLVVDSTRDTFTIEAAWDLNGELPAPFYGKPIEVSECPILFRMNFLWSGNDYWWPLVLRPAELDAAFSYIVDPVEQCLPLVAPAVADAAKKLKEHLVPVFEQVVQKHGSKPAQQTAISPGASPTA